MIYKIELTKDEIKLAIHTLYENIWTLENGRQYFHTPEDIQEHR